MLIVKNGVLITPTGKKNADLAVENKIITKIEEGIEASDGDEVIDARGCFVYPAFWLLDQNEELEEIRENAVLLSDLFEKDSRMKQYELIVGTKRFVTVDTHCKEIRENAVSLFMHRMGDGLDAYGYMKVLCENPAKAKGGWPKRGAIQVGSEAELIVWDPNVKFTVQADDQNAWYHQQTGIGLPRRIRSSQ